MFLRATRELRGERVLGRDGSLGALHDVYFDVDSWQVRYLVVETEPFGASLLIPVACIVQAAPNHLLLELTREQIDLGGGVWALEAAATWLARARVCSGRSAIGCLIEARDGSCGRVEDLLVDEEEWCVDYVVGAIGAPGRARSVLMPCDWVRAIQPEQRKMHMRCTRTELRQSPRLEGPPRRLRAPVWG